MAGVGALREAKGARSMATSSVLSPSEMWDMLPTKGDLVWDELPFVTFTTFCGR